jgi:hypothetical protein
VFLCNKFTEALSGSLEINFKLISKEPDRASVNLLQRNTEYLKPTEKVLRVFSEFIYSKNCTIIL